MAKATQEKDDEKVEVPTEVEKQAPPEPNTVVDKGNKSKGVGKTVYDPVDTEAYPEVTQEELEAQQKENGLVEPHVLFEDQADDARIQQDRPPHLRTSHDYVEDTEALFPGYIAPDYDS